MGAGTQGSAILRDKMKGLSPEWRARIDAETDRLHNE